VITGYNPGTDEVESSSDYLFGQNTIMVRITRRIAGTRLVAVMPNTALVDPYPEEFLWRPVKALGVLDVWWSIHRTPESQPWGLECTYQTADGYRSRQTVTRELVADCTAWKDLQKRLFADFLAQYQDALDEREKTGDLSASE